ncbi:MAG TPA: CHAT domain-containing protein [Coleofasciculaceae cyanobacterium]
MAGLLVNNGVQLAVFNSCRGAYTATSDSLENGKERNLAEALVKRGIPSVLAMAERIPDEVALTLTRLLYRNLNLGYPIDLSLSRARQGLIAAYGSNQLYWALPVLYLHPEFDGFLTNTDNSDHNREDLFTLPDPLDLPLSVLEEEAHFPPPVGNRTFIDDDLTPSFLRADADYEENEFDNYIDGINPDDPDNDDPSAFIQDLLRQIDTKPVTNNSNVVNLEPPTPSVNSQTPTNREFTANSPSSNEEVLILPSVNTNVNTNQSVNRDNSVGLKAGWSRFQRIPRLWQVVGATSILAIALLGLWFWKNQSNPNLDSLRPSPSLPNLPSDNPPGDLTKAGTSLLTNTAIEQFSKGNITEGQQAVEELLNRGALQQAKAALEAVPESQRNNNAAVSFLWGRLTWQFVQTGNKDYDLSDARRYWETAKKKQPKSPTYLTALGFAFYGEGKYDDANNAWFEALYLTEAAQGTTGAGQALSKEVLTIYAGLAMGLQKSAQEQTAEKQANLLNESRKLRQKVMKDAPADFQPDALGKPENWLWTEQAIRDWRSLVANNNK